MSERVISHLAAGGGELEDAAAAGTCPSCDRATSAHSLDEARACLAELARREPPYCRLTGPADRDEWARSVALRTVDQLAHPERYER